MKECIDSILSQTYTNIELIIINDGSTDDSLEILNQYEKNCFTLISQENKGQSYARNLGINKSKGKYILFVDSDDYIKSNTVSSLVKQIEEKNLDLIRFPAQSFKDKSNEYFFESKYNFKKYMIPNKIYSHEAFLKTCYGKGFIASPVLYMVKRDILIKNNIRFPLSYKMFEDEIFTLKLFLNVETAMYDHTHYYFRRYRDSSIMMQKKNKNLESFTHGCQLVKDLYVLLDETTNPIKRKLINNRIHSRLRFLILLNGIDKEFKKKEIMNVSKINSLQFNFLLFVYRLGKFIKTSFIRIKQ